MTTTAVSPRIHFRAGHAPRLPFAVRRARLLSRIAWYAVAWVLFAGASFWLVLGDTVLWLALLLPIASVCNPFRPTRVPRRVRDRARARRWVHSRLSALERALPGGLSPGEGG